MDVYLFTYIVIGAGAFFSQLAFSGQARLSLLFLWPIHMGKYLFNLAKK